MKTTTRHYHFLQFVTSVLLIVVVANPVSSVLASDITWSDSAQATTTASAVIVPVHVAQLGFLISGIARDVPIKEGDLVQAGQTLLVLDTPDLQFAVTEAEAALRSAQSYAELQKYRRIKNRRNGKIFYDVIPVEVRQLADARVQQAQVTLELAQIDLAESTLPAPFDGVVTSLHVVSGEFVPSDQAIVTLATLDNLQLETTDLSERDLSSINVGAPVDIFIAAVNEN